MAASNLTAQRLRELLNYDPETGVFTWRFSTSRHRQAGMIANKPTKNRYSQISIWLEPDGCFYYYNTSRLAWLYVYGVWPTYEIDHRDTIRTNNRIANLRDVPHSINMQNKRAAQANNESGYLGVTLEKRCGRYRARLVLAGKFIDIGYFDTPEEASAAYLATKRKLHPGSTL